MKDHAWYRDSLSAWLDGELSAEEHRWVEEHLRDCSECQSELTQIRRVVDLVHQLPEHDPGTLLVGRIMDRIDRRPQRGPVFKLIFHPAMAMVLLIALGGLFTWRLAPQVSRQTLEQRVAVPEMDESVPIPLASRPLSPSSPPQLKAVPVNKPQLRAAPGGTLADQAGEEGGMQEIVADSMTIAMPVAEMREEKSREVSPDPLPVIEKEQMKSLAFSFKEEAEDRFQAKSLQADADSATPASRAMDSGMSSKNVAVRKAIGITSELESGGGPTAPAESKILPRGRLARNMTPESGPASAAPHRSGDDSLFLKRDHYRSPDVDILLRTESRLFQGLSHQLREAGCSFLESRVGAHYEVQLRLTEENWNSLQENLRGQYQLLEHADPRQPWVEVKPR